MIQKSTLLLAHENLIDARVELYRAKKRVKVAYAFLRDAEEADRVQSRFALKRLKKAGVRIPKLK